MTDTAIIRVKQVAQKCGLSVSMIWHKVNPKSRHYDADFPRPFKISANATGWLESEINDYISQLSNGRQQETRA